ncbi:unnamed protein product [Leptidea sinapis]|uniref:Uncharacterized protein n=1 Tax=Leptidea sinapis TaxID=189913 RepID=A0A5E4QSU2_9NEOP|nr:unnamed protein product [Leptidea sinapis]
MKMRGQIKNAPNIQDVECSDWHHAINGLRLREQRTTPTGVRGEEGRKDGERRARGAAGGATSYEQRNYNPTSLKTRPDTLNLPRKLALQIKTC